MNKIALSPLITTRFSRACRIINFLVFIAFFLRMPKNRKKGIQSNSLQVIYRFFAGKTFQTRRFVDYLGMPRFWLAGDRGRAWGSP